MAGFLQVLTTRNPPKLAEWSVTSVCLRTSGSEANSRFADPGPQSTVGIIHLFLSFAANAECFFN